MSRKPQPSRAKLNPPRRGGVTTSDVIYESDEAEFIAAMAAYQKRTGKRFPTWSESLAVARSLGYRKVETTEDTPRA